MTPEQRVAGRVGAVYVSTGRRSAPCPEGVPVVAGSGQPFRRNRALLGARAGLQRVKEGKADGLLELRVPLELDVGSGPEIVEVRR